MRGVSHEANKDREAVAHNYSEFSHKGNEDRQDVFFFGLGGGTPFSGGRRRTFFNWTWLDLGGVGGTRSEAPKSKRQNPEKHQKGKTPNLRI